MPATAAGQVTLDKNQVVAIDMVSPDAQRAISLAGRAELAVFYTPRFIIQAQFAPHWRYAHQPYPRRGEKQLCAGV